MFHLDDFGRLHDGLLELFPQLSGSSFPQDFSTEFQRRAHFQRGRSWQTLGYFTRDKKSRFVGMDAYREMPHLPRKSVS
jgi:hypothetical protein